MKLIYRFCLLMLFSAIGCSHQQPSQPSVAKNDWHPIFDGKTLNGWHHFGEGKFIVEDGCIVGKTDHAAKLYGHLVTDQIYGDFSVRFKVKTLKGNSGFYIRTVCIPPDRALGLQIEVDPRHNTGGIYESYGRGWVVRPSEELQAKYFKQDQWNDVLIEAYGGHVKVTVNGITSAEIFNDKSRRQGHMLLQMHAGNDMLVLFKDIEVKGEPLTP